MENSSEISVENTSTPVVSSEAENATPLDTAKTEDTSEEESAPKENNEKENADLPDSSTTSEEITKSEADSIPTEYKSALKKAESYSEIMHMSKAGIYDQLISEYGEKFTAEEAQYAIDHLS